MALLIYRNCDMQQITVDRLPGEEIPATNCATILQRPVTFTSIIPGYKIVLAEPVADSNERFALNSMASWLLDQAIYGDILLMNGEEFIGNEAHLNLFELPLQALKHIIQSSLPEVPATMALTPYQPDSDVVMSDVTIFAPPFDSNATQPLAS